MTLDNNRLQSCTLITAAGWSSDCLNNPPPSEGHFIYIHDFRYDRWWMFALDSEAFWTEPSEQRQFGDFVFALQQLHVGGVKDDITSRLQAATVDLVRQSKEYQRWKTRTLPEQRAHVLVQVYPGQGRSTLLRISFVPHNLTIIHKRWMQAHSMDLLVEEALHNMSGLDSNWLWHFIKMMPVG